jgi:DNA-binding MarR family transcriptional regulator
MMLTPPSDSATGAPAFIALEAAPGYLIRRAQQVHNVLWNQELEGRVTSPQYAVLAALAAQPRVDQRRLGEIASLDKSSIADIVARLTSRLWVVRESDPKDARRNVLELTAAAELAFHYLTPAADRVQTRLMAPLNAEQERTFIQGLRDIAHVEKAPTVSANRASPVLELSAPGHLIRRAQQEHTSIWAEEFGRGLTGPQCAVLYVVAGTPGIGQKQLGERAALDKSTAADLVERLVRRGWLERDRTPGDARGRSLTLSTEGQDVVASSAATVAAVQQRLLAPVGEGNVDEFVGALRCVAFSGAATAT